MIKKYIGLCLIMIMSFISVTAGDYNYDLSLLDTTPTYLTYNGSQVKINMSQASTLTEDEFRLNLNDNLESYDFNSNPLDRYEIIIDLSMGYDLEEFGIMMTLSNDTVYGSNYYNTIEFSSANYLGSPYANLYVYDDTLAFYEDFTNIVDLSQQNPYADLNEVRYKILVDKINDQITYILTINGETFTSQTYTYSSLVLGSPDIFPELRFILKNYNSNDIININNVEVNILSGYGIAFTENPFYTDQFSIQPTGYEVIEFYYTITGFGDENFVTHNVDLSLYHETLGLLVSSTETLLGYDIQNGLSIEGGNYTYYNGDYTLALRFYDTDNNSVEIFENLTFTQTNGVDLVVSEPSNVYFVSNPVIDVFNPTGSINFSYQIGTDSSNTIRVEEQLVLQGVGVRDTNIYNGNSNLDIISSSFPNIVYNGDYYIVITLINEDNTTEYVSNQNITFSFTTGIDYPQSSGQFIGSFMSDVGTGTGNFLGAITQPVVYFILMFVIGSVVVGVIYSVGNSIRGKLK